MLMRASLKLHSVHVFLESIVYHLNLHSLHLITVYCSIVGLTTLYFFKREHCTQ